VATAGGDDRWAYTLGFSDNPAGKVRLAVRASTAAPGRPFGGNTARTGVFKALPLLAPAAVPGRWPKLAVELTPDRVRAFLAAERIDALPRAAGSGPDALSPQRG
jgi:hypothetical protein